MSNSKKVLNVFGIIFATILSIVLVLLLMVSPILLSSLSLVNPKKLTKVVTTEQIAQIVMDEEDAKEDKVIAKLLSTNAAKEVFELYATDITNALSGKDIESKLNAETLKKIVEDNIDELVSVMREVDAAPGDMSDEEIKTVINEGILNDMDGLLENLPKPQDLMQQITAENPEMQTAFYIIAKVNIIKLSVIGAVILISALIFVCRLFELRGFKWLSIDLFVASSILILVCAGLFVGSGMLGEIAADNAILSSVLESVFDSFTMGMVIRTAVMLVSAIGLIVAYVFIKKARVKKLSPIDTPIVLETLETEEEPKETV